ncbi:hypothetical protein EC968_008610 [Mortierella alpina]|nr:hypothetical protein EC968_008610 [Mortierella alpina]
MRRIARFELRSIVTLLLVIAKPLQISYDVGISMIKYEEGFAVIPGTDRIVGRLSNDWAQSHQDRAEILDYILACAMALLTSIFFLLQSFYHYISKSVTKSSFMSSFEFRLNIVCSLIVIAVFPLIQYLFRNNHALREAAPQMAFSVVLLIIGILGVRTHFRFQSLLKVAMLTISESTQGVVEKLEYFKDMNKILTGAMFGTGISLGIASVDGLMPHPVIARHKFASDFLVTNLNFFEFIIWVTLVMIFYPRRSGVGNVFGSSSGGSVSRTAPHASRQAQQLKSVHDNSHSNNSKDRPPSHVPYRPPEGRSNHSHSKTEYVDLPLDNLQHKFNQHHNDSHLNRNYNDTYPLTRTSGQQDATDYVQMNAFKAMYDDPLQASPASPRSPTRSPPPPQQQQYGSGMMMTMHSPPQSPVSPSHFRAASPMSSSARVASPGPVYGSPIPRQLQAASSSSAAVGGPGQPSFVLEDPPGTSHQRLKMAMQQQQKQQLQHTFSGDGGGGGEAAAGSHNSYSSYDPSTSMGQSGSAGAPSRPRKEPRHAPPY